MNDSDLISAIDLAVVAAAPGVTAEQRAYAAARASRKVLGHWRGQGDPPEWVRDIAIDVAARWLNNPRALTSWTRSNDDTSRTERVDGGPRPTFGFELTDTELAALHGVKPKRQRVGSIALRVPVGRR